MYYVEQFEKLGFGMFVHFGLYSVLGKGEWAKTQLPVSDDKYNKLSNKFNPKKNWAKNLVSVAKKAGCKYITLTTRHHEGYSLYDTCGLSTFDAPNCIGRDLIREFVDECNKQDIVPFFYHTLLDWYDKNYKNNFPKYIDYLINSVEILCKNYGKIGGLWFDGMWDKPNEDWQEDRLYSTIRKYQPEAMIINNTGLSALGKVGHPELDSVTFERGKPTYVDESDRHRAGEMCQVLEDHWGYCKNDIDYMSIKDILSDLIDCRFYNCNFLLNVGPMGNGDLRLIDKGMLLEIGKWVKANKDFIYNVKGVKDISSNALIFKDNEYYYAVIKDVPMSADPNVQKGTFKNNIKLNGLNIDNAVWLDNGKKIKIKKDNSFDVVPFKYGTSLYARVAKIKIK